MVAIVTATTAASTVCPGSGTFPDIVDDRILDELSYVCATCGASVPNFELAPVHRRGSVDVHSGGHLELMNHVEHYADSFSVQPGHCFRLLTSSVAGSQASPTHCDKPVEFQGRFRDRAEKWHKVESCNDHTRDLTDKKRISASVTNIR